MFLLRQKRVFPTGLGLLSVSMDEHGQALKAESWYHDVGREHLLSCVLSCTVQPCDCTLLNHQLNHFNL